MGRSFDDLRGSLANNLRRARSARRYSQEQLAFLSDIDRTYVSQLERGVVNPSLLVLSKLADALELDVTDLLGR
ncbi:MAG: helix-turn-helix transcriptional regulator [Ectothiorhodospiraceae bacterium]|nr:helix-turn-helix transcriptional regulator [Ectothiorhodospiraceae bacterium]MCC5860250.1 helix-turn-helix transcriptional regulator [Ectothiorhodospiraceae bacterium]